MKTIKVVLFGAVLTVLCGCSTTHPTQAHFRYHLMLEFDKNMDGVIDEKEGVEARNWLDKNNDGKTDDEEREECRKELAVKYANYPPFANRSDDINDITTPAGAAWFSSPYNPYGVHPNKIQYKVTPQGIQQYPKVTPSGIIYTPPK